MAYIVRPARPDETAELQAIERQAGERFREVGLDDVADDEPLPIETLAAYASGGRAWVAADDGEPCGYVLVDDIDGAAHIVQVSVKPDHQGRGIGRALIDRATRWAADTGRAWVTLTTFTDVPWNRPLYEHLGFRVLSDHEIGPGLRRIREDEAAQGLDLTTRVAMRRGLHHRRHPTGGRYSTQTAPSTRSQLSRQILAIASAS